MNPEVWSRLKPIFDRAVDLEAGARDRFVREACAGDRELLVNLRRLLDDYEEAGGFLSTPALMQQESLSTKATFQPDQTIASRFRIVRFLAKGGMGGVYEAEDERLARRVALKFLPQDLSQNRRALERFQREARAASALSHPNICMIHDIGETAEGDHFIVMELLEGNTLREIIAAKALSIDRLVELAVQITGALEAAHARGIVHRDIKPANLFITLHGSAKILDFGVAKLLGEPQRAKRVLEGSSHDASISDQFLTIPGATLGTIAYMSPEQVRGEELDARTDLFSLGLVLYEMATSKPAFVGETPRAIADAILHREPVRPEQLNPGIPSALQRIIDKALEKERRTRYQTAADLLSDLTALKHDSQVGISEEGARAWPTKGLRPFLRWAIAAVLMLLIAVAAIYYRVRPTSILSARDKIVLADFANTTGDPVFDGTLRKALAVALEQSPFFHVFADERVRETLRLMNLPPDEKITSALALEICQRDGLKALIAGSISSLGQNYVVALEAVGQTGEVLAREQAEASGKEQVLVVLGEATSKLRAKLGESFATLQEYNAPLERATTTSLEALKAFSTAQELQFKGKPFEAISLYKRAIELDPNFAMAYNMLGATYSNTYQRDLWLQAAEKAFQLRDRASERERLIIIADQALSTGDFLKAIDTLELFLRMYPLEPTYYMELAWSHASVGQIEEAIRNAQESIRIDMKAWHPYVIGAGAYMRMNRFEEAKHLAQEGLVRYPDSGRIRGLLYAIAFVQGDTAGMKQHVDWATGRPEEYMVYDGRIWAAAFSGHIGKAHELAQRGKELALQRDLKDPAALLLTLDATGYALAGRCREVAEIAAQVLTLSHSRTTLEGIGPALAACGAAATQAVSDELSRRFSRATPTNLIWLPVIAAARSVYRGEYEQALELLETPRPYERAGQLWPSFLRGQACLKLNKAAEAAVEFQHILDHRGEDPLSPIYPLAYLGRARAASLAGDISSARSSYESFLSLWKDADPNLPVLVEAKNEYASLLGKLE